VIASNAEMSELVLDVHGATHIQMSNYTKIYLKLDEIKLATSNRCKWIPINSSSIEHYGVDTST